MAGSGAGVLAAFDAVAALLFSATTIATAPAITTAITAAILVLVITFQLSGCSDHCPERANAADRSGRQAIDLS
jgi:hypothetical protein